MVWVVGYLELTRCWRGKSSKEPDIDMSNPGTSLLSQSHCFQTRGLTTVVPNFLSAGFKKVTWDSDPRMPYPGGEKRWGGGAETHLIVGKMP